jgi:hypothetical protein
MAAGAAGAVADSAVASDMASTNSVAMAAGNNNGRI